jgi:hypothetical protein
MLFTNDAGKHVLLLIDGRHQRSANQASYHGQAAGFPSNIDHIGSCSGRVRPCRVERDAGCGECGHQESQGLQRRHLIAEAALSPPENQGRSRSSPVERGVPA